MDAIERHYTVRSHSLQKSLTLNCSLYWGHVLQMTMLFVLNNKMEQVNRGYEWNLWYILKLIEKCFM
jgi:hypothetical protein